ncbi:MAG: acyl-coenzyme A synthetase/AMP-(fatty) acid ligase/3-hydroxymyristoyl [Psychromonas sp.]|jgi:acyl-coenzyme A synthetase/AMP-(fatty) acid ligase/3-hydroxymyristoyl/3-hydroxydecanoyl-(acyl carrier protein) dehydratase|uniref:ApeI family dehydratase n=1 Tax=Psychromonas sp. TaxID=1884585 RepID=UPI0039E22F69
MNFCSLAQLLVNPRSDQHLVAFDAQQQVTWPELLADVRVLSQKLLTSEQKNWAICCADSYHFCVAFFAAAYAHKKIILPGNHQPAMLASLTNHFDAVIDDGLLSADLKQTQFTLPLANQSITNKSLVNKSLANKPKSTALPFPCLNLSKVRISLFTSGSSGQPKAINKTLLMLDDEIITLENKWGDLLTDSKIVSSVSHQHIYGLLFRLLWPLCAGRAFQRQDLVYPEQLFSSANADSTLISSPALLKRLPAGSEPNPYRAVFSSGGPLPLSAAKACNVLFKQPVFEVFGSTETGGIGFRQQLTADTVWHLFPGIEAKVAQDNCLMLRSPWIDAQAWYRTNDQCELLAEQQFILKGRVDRLVKIEEKRVSLNEVEQRLNQLEWIEESYVVQIENANLTQRISLGAVLKLNKLGAQTIAEIGKGKFWIKLRQALRAWLEPVCIPRKYRIVEQIPMNSQGKLLKTSLLDLFAKKQQAPRSKATIIEQVVSENTALLTLRIDADLIYFDGHFPDYSILPGVTQLDWAIYYAKKMLNSGTRFAGMEVIKFQQPILPNDIVQLTLTWFADKQTLQFSYASAGNTHSSGRVKLEKT